MIATLAQARREDRFSRSTHAPVIHAGAASRSILRRLGFRQLTAIGVLVDASAPKGRIRP